MQIKAPFMFDCEHGVALKAMHGTQASSLGEGKSHIFSRVATVTWGTFQVTAGMAIQSSCLFTDDRTPV